MVAPMSGEQSGTGTRDDDQAKAGGTSSPDHADGVTAPDLDNVIPTHGYHNLPVVGLGGSAGSITMLQKFFAKIPANSGMAYIVVVHLSPDHESTLAEIIQRETSIQVVQVHKTTRLMPDCVYVIPPAKHLSIMEGHIVLADIPPVRGKRVAVDLLFRTLADTHGPNATAIVLSGADGDGSIGIKRIKERGGLTIVQDPTEADFDSMPRAAIQTGMVDWVLPVEQMPERLLAYRRAEKELKLPAEAGPGFANGEAAPPLQSTPAVGDELLLREILIFLRMRTGREFAYYKRATVVRRIGRRMQVNGLTDLAGYLAFMRTHPGEAGALLKDLLISVTNFFRDTEAFHALEGVIGELFHGKSTGDTVRVWVTACATGEEAYSVLMLFSEFAARLSAPPSLQVFATDLDADAINVAREGFYPATIVADVSEQRLKEFFVAEHGGYRIKRSVREMVLFATHDLVKDSPFSRVDLITSRNLLIYLNKEAQTKVFDIFHFALKPGGLLFLGASEAADEGAMIFTTLDKKHRIYARKDVPARAYHVPHGPSTMAMAMAMGGQQQHAKGAGYSLGSPEERQITTPGLPGAAGGRSAEAQWNELHPKLMERFSPPSVITDASHQIVHLSENANRFLTFAPGVPTTDILRVVQPALRVELRAALFRAAQTGMDVEVTGLPAAADAPDEVVDMLVSPVRQKSQDYFMVIFQQRSGVKSAPGTTNSDEPLVLQLEKELVHVKENLHATVEQYAASIEELKAANEELQAMNEELRSATEEMETGREELQSINEELTTVNQESKNKVEELARANGDLQNLMASTAIATVFLDRGLHIQRYTPSALQLFNLIPTDIGRPLSHLAHHLMYPDILADAENVLTHLSPVEREVANDSGLHFLARMLPYRTAEDQIAGVVLTFLDITRRKKAEEHLLLALAENKAARVAAEDAARAKDHFMALLSHELRTPLTPVMMMMPTLLEDSRLDENLREILTMVSRNVDMEAGLIDQLLDFTRMSNGEVDYKMGPFDLHAAISQAVDVATAEIDSRQQMLHLQLEAGDSAMHGDETRLRQAIWNVIKNASKFTPEGGKINISTASENGSIVIVISDSGIGLTAKDLGKVFNPFEQGDKEMPRQHGGLGLGLSIAKAAIEGHHGTISVSSAGRGKGCAFTIRLPLKQGNGTGAG